MLNIGTIFALLKLRDQMSPALKTASAKLKKLGTSMKQTGTSMATGLTLPIVAMGAAAGVAFGSFEKNMNRVRALTGATGGDFDKLTDLAKELGKTTQFSAREAADAMGFLAMAGFKTNEILGALPGVLELASSASLDLASAADITTNILTGYGRTVEQVGETNDILVKAFTSANTDLVQLGQAFKFVGPVAKGAGLQFEEVTAMLAMMGNAGIQASMAGTGLRGAIVRLVNPTNKVNQALLQNGIITKDASGKLLPMTDIIAQLGDQSVSTGDMMTIFGMRAGPALIGLVGQGADAIRKLTGELEGAGGTASRVARIQLEGLNGAFIKFKSAAEGALIEVGEQLAPTFERLFEILIKGANWISNVLVPAFTALSPTTQNLIIGFTGLVTVLGPLLIVFGQLFIALGAIAGALPSLSVVTTVVGTAFGVLKAVLLGTVAVLGGPLTLAVGALIALFAGWSLRNQISEFTWFKKVSLRVRDALGMVTDEMRQQEEQMIRYNGIVKDITPSFEELETALGEAGATGSVKELHTAMANLGGVVGGLNEDQMQVIAQRAIQLREAGEELTPELARVADHFLKMAKDAEEAEAELKRTQEREAKLAKQSAELATAIESLRKELSREGLAGEVQVLQGAWEALTPAQRANELIMGDMAERAMALAEQGAKLTDEQQRLVEQTEAAAKALEAEAEATKKAEQATARMDQAIRKFLKHDLDEELAFLEEKYERLAVRTDFTAEASLALGKEFQALANKGVILTGEALRLAQAWVTDTEATEANTNAKKRADAVIKQFSLEPLRQQATELATGFAELTA